jgi:predicted flap endonuclease-1-like 5' DNA nuclease
MATLETVEGIGPTYAEKLERAGVFNTEELLEQGAKPDGRKAMAEKSGISEKQLLNFINKVDLMRIKGVGEEFSDLLEASGVDSVPELAQRRADNLTKKMEEVNAEKNLCRATPSESVVEGWIEQAKTMERAVFH